MAKETKIGLLAGLAFIICFAIILANRGQRPLVTPMAMPGQSASPATPGLGSSALPSASVVTDASARQLDPHFQPQSKGIAAQYGSPSKRIGTQPTPQHRPTTPPVGSASSLAMRDDARFVGTAGTRATPVPIGAYQTPQELTTNQLSQYLGLPEGADRGSTRRGQAHGNRQGGSARRTAANQRFSHDAGRVSQTRGTPPRPAQRTAAGTSRRYTVVPGDTLSRIASAHYGTSSRSVIMAIFEANRAVLSNPDHLRSGVDLVLPTIQRNRESRTAPGLTGRPASSFSSSPYATANNTRAVGANRRSTTHGLPISDGLNAAARKATERTSSADARASFRWYQIRSGDRYISIARDQLGDASRWPEIHELNKDKFSDPGRIRVGVRIKLPMASTKVAQGTGR